jgi:hypothetical protein
MESQTQSAPSLLLNVHPGFCAVTQPGAKYPELSTAGVGSCVVVLLRNPATKRIGLAHVRVDNDPRNILCMLERIRTDQTEPVEVILWGGLKNSSEELIARIKACLEKQPNINVIDKTLQENRNRTLTEETVHEGGPSAVTFTTEGDMREYKGEDFHREHRHRMVSTRSLPEVPLPGSQRGEGIRLAMGYDGISPIKDYTKSTRYTSRRPQKDIGGGTEPLTVVEFSFMEHIREKLEKKLLPYVKGEITDESGLGKIIEECFPPQVLDELRVLSKESGNPSQVFIIRNLPEITREKIPEELKQSTNDAALKHWIKKHSYAAYINKGVGQALDLIQPKNLSLVRHPDSMIVDGDVLHKHLRPVSVLNVITTDGAKTRFTDMQAVTEHPDASSVQVRLDADDIQDKISLNDFSTRIPDWMSSKRDIEVIPFAAEDKRKLEPIVAESSLEEAIGPGMMALWANDGRVFHQALLSNQPEGFRAAINTDFRRR